MSTKRAASLAAVTLVAAACSERPARDSAPPGSAPAADAQAIEGTEGPDSVALVDPSTTVRRVGTVRTTGIPDLPVITLTGEGDGTVTLTGPLTDELGRLSGAEVEVAGVLAEGPVGPTLVVASYEVVSIDGVPATMGVLTEAEGVYWLRGEPDVRLGTVPAGLAREVGSLVWITGSPSEDGVRVQSFGVIRPR